jgi:hypothetical protein
MVIIVLNGDFWIIIHMYMESSQGNSLYSHLKQTKMESRRTEQVLSGGDG